MANFNRSSLIPSPRNSYAITQRRRDSNLIGDKRDESLEVSGEDGGSGGSSSLYSWEENGRVCPESSR